MLFLHEVHTVAGAKEDEFEAAFRDGWMPLLAKGEDARLLWYFNHAHGSGPSYNVVTVTAVRDGAAWEDLARRIQRGDLREWASDVDRLRHDAVAKVLLPVPWSAIQEVDLAGIPAGGVEHEPTLFMEDTVWPYEGKLDEYIEAAGTLYAQGTVARHSRPGQSLLEIQACFQTAFGAGLRREIVLVQKILRPDFLLGLLTREIPPEHRAPGTWMHDGLAFRDRWASKLLRTSTWSPLH